MSGFASVGQVNVVPPVAGVPDGVIVFPVPEALAWIVIVGVLVVCCSVLGLAGAGRLRRPRSRPARPRRFTPVRPHPQRL